jgi:enoyl-CoA hydratase/methylglutaconyl-CoA hydratase
LVTTVAPEADMDDTVAGILADLRLGHRQGLSAAKELLTADLLADFDARGEEMARLSGLLFHSDVAQQRMAAALRR